MLKMHNTASQTSMLICIQIFDNQLVESVFRLPSKPYRSLCDVLPGGLYRVVFKNVNNVLKRLNALIVNVLNIVCTIMNVMKYAYLCEAKVPYYGRSTYRH